MNKDKIVERVINAVKDCYNIEHKKLYDLSITANTEGEIREAAGNLIENILQKIFDTINECLPDVNIVSKVGNTDFLSKEIIYKGRKLKFDTIQVDRHVWSKNKRICFIENKTYLDSCYYDRALADFRKIAQSLKQHDKNPADYKYIVFAGQNAANENTMFIYEADFWNDTKHLTKNEEGLETKTFFFLKNKRQSSKPLYKFKHELNTATIKEFTLYILDILRY